MMGEALRTLVWLLLTLGGAAVPPPTDVKVSCRNVQVQVGWNHSSAHPAANFTVMIVGDKMRKSMKVQAERHCDLTHIVWGSEELLGNYFVNVSASVGDDHSVPATSQTFTFNDVKTASLTCKLDFPPVKLVREHSGTKVRIRNPFHFYKELEQFPIWDKEALVTIVSDSDFEIDCGANDETCQHDVQEEVKCVTLEGKLYYQSSQVSFKRTEPICVAADPSPTLWIVVSTVLAIVALTAIAIAVVLCATRCCLPNGPHIIVSSFQGLFAMTPHPNSSLDICVVHPVPNKEPLLQDSMDSSMDGSRPYLGAMGGFSESSGGDDDSSEKTESVSVDSEEPQESGYDSRHFPIDMGNGETVMAYKE